MKMFSIFFTSAFVLTSHAYAAGESNSKNILLKCFSGPSEINSIAQVEVETISSRHAHYKIRYSYNGPDALGSGPSPDNGEIPLTKVESEQAVTDKINFVYKDFRREADHLFSFSAQLPTPETPTTHGSIERREGMEISYSYNLTCTR